MPYQTIWEEKGVKWVFYGHVTAEELRKANEDFYLDPRSKKATYELINTVLVEDLEWAPVEIVELSANDVAASRGNNHLKMAFVVDNPDLMVKIEKYMAISRTLNSGWKIREFSTEAEAREWLNEQ